MKVKFSTTIPVFVVVAPNYLTGELTGTAAATTGGRGKN